MISKGIGFSRNLRLPWLDAVAALCGETDDPAEIRSRLEAVIALDLGETREIYGELDNVHIVDYPLGGFPLTRKDDALRPEVYDDLVAETARLIVKISKEGDPVPPTVDYDKHGWPRRIDRELAIYDALVRGDAPE